MQNEQREAFKEKAKSLIYQLRNRVSGEEDKSDWVNVNSNQVISSLVHEATILQKGLIDSINGDEKTEKIFSDTYILGNMKKIIKSIKPNEDFLVPINVKEKLNL